MVCPVIVSYEDEWITATEINTHVASQGKTVNAALENLKEALELYYEDTPKETLAQAKVLFTTLEVNV